MGILLPGGGVLVFEGGGGVVCFVLFYGRGTSPSGGFSMAFQRSAAVMSCDGSRE